MGTGCSLPVAGANEDFAVLAALFAMKLVNRHGGIIRHGAEKLNTGELDKGPKWDADPAYLWPCGALWAGFAEAALVASSFLKVWRKSQKCLSPCTN